MRSHPFGGTWCPSVCTYALQQVARDHSEDFSPEVTGAVQRDFYVDDLLKSVPEEKDAIKVVKELPRLLERGGFHLHKWASNSAEVLQAIPEPERVSGARDLASQALPVERALGVLWDTNHDSLTYAVKQSARPMTRRGLLGVVCSVYDPLGFLTPFTIRGKRLVQDMAREKVGWDEPLEDRCLQEWMVWLQELEAISGISIPRCVQARELGEIVRIELHHFSDASMTAFGSVSYIRFLHERGVHCSLLFSRSRVAPLKKMTIPRLELAAAVLSVQQDLMMRQDLSLSIDESVFWTDSMIVLAYIQNKQKRFHTFVANRLAMIHAGSLVNQWKHVKSEQNPADDISRGLSLAELINSERWQKGPEFLQEKTTVEEKRPSAVIEGDDPEVKCEAVTLVAVPRDSLDQLLERYSSWERLKRAVAWILKFKVYLRASVEKRPQDLDALRRLTVQDLFEAETAVIKLTQEREYSTEREALGTGERVKRSSRIHSLDPGLTDRGVLVCRIRATKMPSGNDNSLPVILPKSSPVSMLLVRHFHEMCGHMGREYVVAEVRQRYWIPGLRMLVRRVLRECRRCRRLYATPSTQRMGDLPDVRLARDKPPFSKTGVDCFGPFVTKLGRRHQKRYGCIFTCMTSRAVHLEVLDSMDTDSFINALQRFISRRGQPDTICCDNGTNFVGAERELRESVNQWSQQRLDSFLSRKGIEWRFNPPMASHMGGAWERLIRSVRRVLSAVLTEQVPSDDTLHTMMCLVEDILNGRPLTTVSDDPADLDPLTPNHLLQVKPTRLLPQGVFDAKDCYVRRRWRQVQYLADLFWKRWLKEYLPWIQLRTKWRETKPNLSVNDIVLVVDYSLPRNQWQIGRVINVSTGHDGLVRSAQVRTRTSTLTRPINKLCYLEGHN